MRRLAAMRCYMRDISLGRETQPPSESVRMTEEQIYQMYRLLAVAKYEERYVIPTSYAGELPAAAMTDDMGGCSLSVDGGPGMYTGRSVPGRATYSVLNRRGELPRSAACR